METGSFFMTLSFGDGCLLPLEVVELMEGVEVVEVVEMEEVEEAMRVGPFFL